MLHPNAQQSADAQYMPHVASILSSQDSVEPLTDTQRLGEDSLGTCG